MEKINSFECLFSNNCSQINQINSLKSFSDNPITLLRFSEINFEDNEEKIILFQNNNNKEKNNDLDLNLDLIFNSYSDNDENITKRMSSDTINDLTPLFTKCKITCDNERNVEDISDTEPLERAPPINFDGFRSVKCSWCHKSHITRLENNKKIIKLCVSCLKKKRLYIRKLNKYKYIK